ncbi:hypothetical protein Goshw_017508, partial [Gossypium schwendimanii]|nr:hypothetical protein [Gossypium schwendimanii]
PFLRELEQHVFRIDVLKAAVKNTSAKLLDAFVVVDSTFEFVDYPLDPSQVRFGKPLKNTSNTNIFEHSGKLYSITENDLPQEIDILTLEALGDWDVNGAWNRSFTAHPKRVPGTGELVTMGIAVTKPFVEVGVISGIIHKLDLKLDDAHFAMRLELQIGKVSVLACVRYIVFMDCPLTIDGNRFIRGGHEGNARIGIMPRYGDADSIQWFKVKPNCTFHIINCFEDGDE